MELYEQVIDHRLVTDWFGCWPSFHDAEILSMHLDREPLTGDVGPSLTVRFHAFEMTREIDGDGRYKLEKHAIVTFDFDGVEELALRDFNYQNVIACLTFAEGTTEEGRPGLQVHFQAIFGVGCLFQCLVARVRSVEPASAS